jgi:hypothetical protein
MSGTVVSGLILVDSSPKYDETYLCFEEIGAADGETMKVETRYLDAAGRWSVFTGWWFGCGMIRSCLSYHEEGVTHSITLSCVTTVTC